MDELKPCPFCGKAPTPDFSAIDGEAAYHFHCQNAECSAWPNVSGETEADAITAWNTRPSVTDEMVEVRIGILGCDDSTYLTRQMTKEQFTFLEEVAEQISEQSTYGCMPVMNAALTAALGGPHG